MRGPAGRFEDQGEGMFDVSFRSPVNVLWERRVICIFSLTMKLGDKMSRRSIQSESSLSQDEVLGTYFDEREPPAIPDNLPPNVRNEMSEILESSPHLWDRSQLPFIKRVAEGRLLREKIRDTIYLNGIISEDEDGEIFPNKLLATLNTVERSLISLEKNLGLPFSSQNFLVKDAEKKQPATRGRKPGSGKAAKLRLA